MKVELNIPAATIANMMCSAIESGDPVTHARKGGWCAGIYWQAKGADLPEGLREGNWYFDHPEIYEKINTTLEIHEVIDDGYDPARSDDENVEAGVLMIHQIGRFEMAKGLAVMATKYPRIFKQVIEDDTDAPCADIFLQCTLFGEEKYA